MLTRRRRPPLDKTISCEILRWKSILTQWKGFEKSRIWQSLFAGGARGASEKSQQGAALGKLCDLVGYSIKCKEQSKPKSLTYRPEVVDKHIEDTEDNHQHHSTKLRLEANNYHHACHEAHQADNDSANTPVAGKHKSDKEEDE